MVRRDGAIITGRDHMDLSFHRVQPDHSEAAALIEELSAALAGITGASGKNSFANCDVEDARSVFVIAKSRQGPMGCGGLRRIDDDTCEIKRMYAKISNAGIGSDLLRWLEQEAEPLCYRRILVETRKVNAVAVRFYLKHGYAVIPNYGKYAGNPAAACFAKQIAPRPMGAGSGQGSLPVAVPVGSPGRQDKDARGAD